MCHHLTITNTVLKSVYTAVGCRIMSRLNLILVSLSCQERLTFTEIIINMRFDLK